LSVLPLSQPAADRREALQRLAGTAAPIGDTISTRRVPRHADHLRAVIAIVDGHHKTEEVRNALISCLSAAKSILVERFGIVEVVAQRIGPRSVLVEKFNLQTIRDTSPTASGACPKNRRCGRRQTDTLPVISKVRVLVLSSLMSSTKNTPSLGGKNTGLGGRQKAGSSAACFVLLIAYRNG